MSASNGGVIIDWPQAMPPDSPAMELEVVGPSSPSVTPCPAAAARADADIDHGGGTAEFEGMSDQQLQDRINLWKGPEQSILRRMPDGGEKMQARIHRMKEELERRRARKWKDDSVLRQAKAKHTGGSRADISNFSNMKWNIAKNKASPSPKIKKDVVLLDDDDDVEPARSTDVQISNKWDESKIHYPSSTDPEAVELTYSDMKCLEPEQYLKSPVINFFLQYLKKSRHRTDLYMFNTYFYSKLEEALSTPGDQDSKFNKLRRWWRSVDIFKKAYIILPIHESMHWSLIIVCMPTKEADSGPMMLHLDSLGLHPSQKLFDIVTRYIQAEWRHLQKDSYDVPFLGRTWKRLPKNINGKNVEVPRQRNDYDCGLFMLYYIDRFIQEAPERLTKEGLGMFGRRWFKHEEASALREKLRAIMFDLFHSALDDDGPSELELDPGEDKDILMA